MLRINGTSIALTRGDTAYLTIPIKVNGQAYVMDAEDRLTMSLKNDENERSYVMQKSIIGDNVFHIEPSDTSSLKFKKYVYDVQLNTADGDVFTVIPYSTFEILIEVTC